ncbi:pyrroloquinoline quinone precursor peptide PqqA [Streptomyces sp. NPDC055400]
MLIDPAELMAEPTQVLPPAGTGSAHAEAWQTPGYVVVETALEVTAYALATR